MKRFAFLSATVASVAFSLCAQEPPEEQSPAQPDLTVVENQKPVDSVSERDANLFQMLKEEKVRNDADTQFAATNIRAVVLRTKDEDVLLEPMGGDFRAEVSAAVLLGVPAINQVITFQGGNSPVRTLDNEPEIYFISNGKLLRNSVYVVGFGRKSATSNRKLYLQGGTFSFSSSYIPRETYPVEIVAVQPNIYKVSLGGTLKPGEYGLFIPRIATSGALSGTFGWLFDFGIDKPAKRK